MAWLTLSLVAALALGVFVALGAILELFRDVQQLRESVGIADQPVEVKLGEVAGASPSAYGLPEELDEAPSAIVLFLHDTCPTCQALAAGFEGKVPEGLWVVMEAINSESADRFLERHQLPRRAPRLIVDEGQRMAARLGLDVASTALRIHNGAIVSASTVPSTRYLRSIMPRTKALKSARG